MLKQKEWIDVIVTKTGCTKKDAKAIFDCMFEYIKEQICAIIEIYCKQVSGGDFRSPPFPIYPDTSGFQ